MKFVLRFLFLAGFVVNSFASIAQTDSTDTEIDTAAAKTRFTEGYANSIGLYMRTPFSIFSGTTTNLYPYRLYYRRYFGDGNKNALRFGARMDADLNGIKIDGDTQTQSSGLDFRVGAGYERYHTFNDRFYLYFGGEASYYRAWSNEKTSNESFELNVRNTRNHFGISPLVGIEIRLLDRLSLSSELMYTAALSFDKRQNENTEMGNTTTTIERNLAFETRLNFPRALVLSFHF